MATPLPDEGVAEALDVVEHPEEVIPPTVDDAGDPIPDSLRFVTPDRADDEQSDAEEEILEFELDGTRLLAVRPDPEVWGLLVSSLAQSATIADRLSAVWEFASLVLDEGSFLVVKRRVYDKADPFGTEMLAQIVDQLIRAWTPEATLANRAARRQAARTERRRR